MSEIQHLRPIEEVPRMLQGCINLLQPVVYILQVSRILLFTGRMSYHFTPKMLCTIHMFTPICNSKLSTIFLFYTTNTGLSKGLYEPVVIPAAWYYLTLPLTSCIFATVVWYGFLAMERLFHQYYTLSMVSIEPGDERKKTNPHIHPSMHQTCSVLLKDESIWPTKTDQGTQGTLFLHIPILWYLSSWKIELCLVEASLSNFTTWVWVLCKSTSMLKAISLLHWMSGRSKGLVMTLILFVSIWPTIAMSWIPALS